MPVSLTVTNTADLTNDEAGAVCAFMLALYPDCLSNAAERLNQPDLFTEAHATTVDLEALARGTPKQKPVTPNAPVDAAAAFGGDAPLADTTQTQLTDAAAAFGGTVQHGATGGGATADPTPSGAGATAQPTASPSSVQLDSTGLPHDPRIHSEPPTLTKEGAGPWRKRRGLNQLTENQVIAELRLTYPAPMTAAQRTAQEAVADGLMPAEAGAPLAPVPAPSPASAAAPPPPPTTAPAPPAPPVADPDDATPPATQFAAAMQLATAAQAAGQITMADTQAIIADLGLTSMRDLLAPANHHLIAAFRARIETATKA